MNHAYNTFTNMLFNHTNFGLPVATVMKFYKERLPGCARHFAMAQVERKLVVWGHVVPSL